MFNITPETDFIQINRLFVYFVETERDGYAIVIDGCYLEDGFKTSEDAAIHFLELCSKLSILDSYQEKIIQEAFS